MGHDLPLNLYPFAIIVRQALQMLAVLTVNGAPDRIRTCDPCLRRAVLYPAELRVHFPHLTYSHPCGKL